MPSISGERTSSFKSPQEIRGYPEAQPSMEVRRQRKKRKSIIATDSPEKEQLSMTASKSRKVNSKCRKKNYF